jgi:hypothetical protein
MKRRETMRKKVLLTIASVLLLVSSAAADPGDTLWTRTYGGSESDGCYSVQETSDGGYIVAGQTWSFGAGLYDFYLLKTDSEGDTLWTRTYGGSSHDLDRSVQQTSDGGYIIGGSTNSFGAGDFDVYLVRTDFCGDALWTRTYGGSDSDYGWCVRQTSDGGFIIAAETYSFGAGMSDLYLLKTDSEGDTLWTRSYGGIFWDRGNSVQQTTDGGYIITGETYSFDAPYPDVYLLKTDSSGDTLWTRTYGGGSWDWGESVQQTSDGGYIIAGYTESFGAGLWDIYLLRTDDCGDTLWTRTYGGSRGDYGYSVQQTSDGGYVIAGWTESFGAGAEDVYLVKTDSEGDTLWTRTYGGWGSDGSWSVQKTSDGGFILAGLTTSFGAGSDDAYLLKVAGGEFPEVSIEIIPDDPQVRVPQGGSFGFTGRLTNNVDRPQVVDAATVAVGPQKGVYGPFKKLLDIELQAYETRSAHFDQHVNDQAPLGVYNYIAYCRDYPSTVIDSSFFQIEVTQGISAGGDNSGWVLSGSFDRSDDFASVPSEFALLNNYPNPFNASTVIEYELPQACEVTLEVCNLLGEKITTLVDKKEQAGYRSVIWDASEVSSGVYFYKLTAGDFTETKRMFLVK